jgi:hypothetical protein
MDAPGDADATSGHINGLGVGFGRWSPHRGQSSKNIECLRRQREKGDPDTGHLKPHSVIVIKKYDLSNVSRTEKRLVVRT